jgi:hypothetical protein
VAELVVLGELLAFVSPLLLELVPIVALLAGNASALDEPIVTVSAGRLTLEVSNGSSFTDCVFSLLSGAETLEESSLQAQAMIHANPNTIDLFIFI